MLKENKKFKNLSLSKQTLARFLKTWELSIAILEVFSAFAFGDF
jgi:hypothetical protein